MTQGDVIHREVNGVEEKKKKPEQEEEEKKTEDAGIQKEDSNRAENIFARTMSFLASLPRKLLSYVREVFYSQQEHRWSRVGQDDSEDSDWSSSEDGSTPATTRQRSRSARAKGRHKAKTNKGKPPPIAPKPKKPAHAQLNGSGSSNPPSSPESTTAIDTTPEISFDDITIETPKLKAYKRIHGPQGRRLPQRYSNQSDVRQSEISTT